MNIIPFDFKENSFRVVEQECEFCFVEQKKRMASPLLVLVNQYLG